MKKFLEDGIDELVDFALWGSWYWFLFGILFSMLIIDLLTELDFGYWLLLAPLAMAIQFFGCLFIASVFSLTLGFYDEIEEDEEEYDDQEDEEPWEWE